MPVNNPAANAARFAAGLCAWWWPGIVSRPAPAILPGRVRLIRERDALQRWEDEGGNVK